MHKGSYQDHLKYCALQKASVRFTAFSANVLHLLDFIV